MMTSVNVKYLAFHFHIFEFLAGDVDEPPVGRLRLSPPSHVGATEGGGVHHGRQDPPTDGARPVHLARGRS